MLLTVYPKNLRKYFIFLPSKVEIVLTNIFPSSASTSLKSPRVIELFPAPVRPTIPTFAPPPIEKLNCFKTKSVSGLKGRLSWKEC